MSDFAHRALELPNDKKVIFTALSKKLFYFRYHIVKFVLEQDCVPVNPFTSFEYFLLDTLPRDVVRVANNTLANWADELWVFGDISDGVLAEIKQVKAQGKPVRYFKIVASQAIQEIESTAVQFEAEVPKTSLE